MTNSLYAGYMSIWCVREDILLILSAERLSEVADRVSIETDLNPIHTRIEQAPSQFFETRRKKCFEWYVINYICR